MRLLSKPEERISSKLNAVLSQIVPVVYGAVFSYSMYVLSRILLNAWEIFRKNGNINTPIRVIEPFLEALIIFSSIMVFMIQDIGSIFKLASKFPYKRTSRYTYEMWIAAIYVAVFAFIEICSYVTIVMFALAVILSGLWCNQFKEEYKNHKSKIDSLMETERDIYYSFGVIILFEAALFIFFYRETNISLNSTIVFILTQFIFLTIITFLPFIKHGKNSLLYTVNILFPDYFFKKLKKVI